MMHYQKAFSLYLLLDTLEPHRHKTHTQLSSVRVRACACVCVSKKKKKTAAPADTQQPGGFKRHPSVVSKITGLLLRSADRLFMKHCAIVQVMKDA